MSMRLMSVAAVALGLAALAACSSAPADASADAGAFDGAFPADPYVSATSDDAALHVDVRTDPQPPPRGTCSVELAVTDAHGATRDALGVTVVPWMPAMGHGSSILTNVAPRGEGKYLVTNVAMFMPGQWELRMTFADGPTASHATAIVTVP